MTERAFVRVERQDDGVLVLTLDRPEKKNAISPELAEQWIAALDGARQDAGVRVVVVKGEGDSFCAGADVGIFLALADGPQPHVMVVNRLPEAIRSFPKPIFAAVSGRAVGMGVTILPHFDVVYAGEGASFMAPFVRLGLVQEFGSSTTLPRLIGRQRAAEFLYSAEPLDAKTAAEWGLVARVYPDREVVPRLLRLAQVVASHPPGAVAEAKALLRAGEDGGYAASHAAEGAALAKRYGSPENVAAVQAFLASRRR